MSKGNDKFFYISTNNSWGGSEILWYESAVNFINKKYKVSIAVKYDNEKIDKIKSALEYYVDMRKKIEKLTLFKRIINKITLVFNRVDTLLLALQKCNPDIVIISQGNNISSADIMELCIKYNFRFVIVSQLVAELNWFWLDDNLRNQLVNAYERAVKCFFVSKDNLTLHEFLLAYNASNAEIIHNPYFVEKTIVKYPDTTNGYEIALVGRIECYHKGLDLLIQILACDKWKSRAIKFNLYGDGPHINIIKSLIEKLKIKNVFVHGFISDVSEIWSVNHALMQPSRMEGQSLSLLEALNLNRTAIVTNVGGASEVIKDNVTGFIAWANTIESIDNALERAWERRPEWEDIGIKAGNAVRNIKPKDPISFFNNKILKITESVEGKKLSTQPVN